MESCHKTSLGSGFMEKYLLPDIIYNILAYLNKDDSFHFINICKSVMKQKHYLYKKYIFNYGLLNNHNNQFIHHIQNMKSTKLIDFSGLTFNNLTTLYFYVNDEMTKTTFDFYLYNTLTNLPKTLLNLTINSDLLNLPLNALTNDPINLKILHVISNKFNQPINNLPSSLMELHIIAGNFNQSIDNLPTFLKNLHIDSDGFNQLLNSLPHTLEKLCIRSDEFNQSFNNLPISLNSIKLFIPNYCKEIDLLYLQKLRELQIYNDDGIPFYKLLKCLPINLKILKLKFDNIDYSLNNLPKTLKCLILNTYQFNQSLDALPKSLKKLIIISNTFNKSVSKLPENLTELQIASHNFDQSFSNLPHNLKILRIYSLNYNCPLNKLPHNLQILMLNCRNLKKSFSKLPTSLKIKIINDYYSYKNDTKHKYKGKFVVDNCDWFNDDWVHNDLNI